MNKEAFDTLLAEATDQFSVNKTAAGPLGGIVKFLTRRAGKQVPRSQTLARGLPKGYAGMKPPAISASANPYSPPADIADSSMRKLLGSRQTSAYVGPNAVFSSKPTYDSALPSVWRHGKPTGRGEYQVPRPQHQEMLASLALSIRARGRLKAVAKGIGLTVGGGGLLAGAGSLAGSGIKSLVDYAQPPGSYKPFRSP